MRAVFVACMLAVLGACAADRAKPRPIARLQPRYPPEAEQRGQEGWVTVRYTVTATGTVANAEVVAAEPPGVFDASALRAVRNWRYAPAVRDGRPVATPAQTAKLQFRLPGANDPGAPVVRVAPVYPRRAAEQGIGGWVVLQFDIKPDGRTTNVKVVESRPQHTFDSAAIRAVQKWRYEPKTVNGRPVTFRDVKTKLSFTVD